MQRFLHPLAQLFVFAGDHGGGQCVLGDFTGQVRSGQHADAGFGGDFLEDLAHQLERMGFDAFGQAD
ncbi:hypothetical protein D3C80_1997900 [compost metagenome]